MGTIFVKNVWEIKHVYNQVSEDSSVVLIMLQEGRLLRDTLLTTNQNKQVTG